jgi:hypothetical protein
MKRIFFACALMLLVSIFAPTARSQDVSIDFFYNNIDGGNWIEVGDYGYCWQPDVAASDRSWRPYADGYWAYTDLGWTWVSYEDWGWATYHYGRWLKLADQGWVWVPGYRWGPAWVSWRFGGGYAGWAPLPPETEVVYESRPLTGHLDIEFDIGPTCYNFVDVRYFGEPVLRSRLVPYEQNITYVTQTVNVTNVIYKNKTVYNYGPDLNAVNQFSSRPVQRLKLDRQSNVDLGAAAKSGSLTKVQGNQLVVAAPQEIKKAGNTPPPPKVKTKLDQPKIEKGWSVVGDENAKNQFKEKLKAEDPKKIPPPNIGGNAANAANANAQSTSGMTGSPFEKGKGKGKNKNKQADQIQAGAGTMTAPGESETMPERGKGKGKHKNRGVDQSQAGPTGSTMISPAAESSTRVPPETGKPGKPLFGGASPSGGGEELNQHGKRKGIQNIGPSSGGPANPIQQDFNEERGNQKQSEQPPPGSAPIKPVGVNVPPQGGETGAAKHEGRGKPQGAAATATPGP